VRPLELSARVQRIALAGTAALMMAGSACAGTLVYTPTNPTFGGNPLNGSTLFNSAQVQNQHQPTSGSSSSSANTPLTQGQIFAQQLTSQLYASLANSITQAIFGANAAPSGTFSFAGTTITYANDGTNVRLTINDGSTTTTVTLPSNAINH
jgi:curli production assembly/transport component CsgF